MRPDEVVRLVQAVAWPVIIALLAVLYRKEIPKLFLALGGKISKFTAVGLTLEFTAPKPIADTLSTKLNEIREPTSTGLPIPSAAPALVELIRSSAPADYLLIDLREGSAWLTSRLYLFAVVLLRVTAVKSFVFIGEKASTPRYFYGIASLAAVERKLELRCPWLRSAKLTSQIQQIYSWTPTTDQLKADLKTLTQGPTVESLPYTHAAAFEHILRDVVEPVDLLQPGQAEIFVTLFLGNPKIRRPDAPKDQTEAMGWVDLTNSYEHAQWIKDEGDLRDLIGDDLTREYVSMDTLPDSEALGKTVIRKKGDFVTLLDKDGRFLRLVDRAALLEKMAIGA
jgi:hypothetical protein